ncbi:MAG: hypothetical protein ABIH11_02430 [Candidatus Altiarchaeota archaeon]
MDIDNIQSLDELEVEIPVQLEDGSIERRILSWQEYYILEQNKSRGKGKMDIDDIKSLEDLEVEFQVDDGKGGKKDVRMTWSEFMTSDQVPKEFMMKMLKSREDDLSNKDRRVK